WTLVPPAALASFSREHKSAVRQRSDAPVALMRALLDVPTPRDAFDFRVLTAGTVALFLATMGEYDDAQRVVDRVRDVPPDPDDGPGWRRGFARPQASEVDAVIARLRLDPLDASPWASDVPGCEECGLYAALDAGGAARAAASVAHDAAAERRHA